jgi:hypothetical protein
MGSYPRVAGRGAYGGPRRLHPMAPNIVRCIWAGTFETATFLENPKKCIGESGRPSAHCPPKPFKQQRFAVHQLPPVLSMEARPIVFDYR